MRQRLHLEGSFCQGGMCSLLWCLEPDTHNMNAMQTTCVANCADKFLKHSERVGARFAEQNSGTCRVSWNVLSMLTKSLRDDASCPEQIDLHSSLRLPLLYDCCNAYPLRMNTFGLPACKLSILRRYHLVETRRSWVPRELLCSEILCSSALNQSVRSSLFVPFYWATSAVEDEWSRGLRGSTQVDHHLHFGSRVDITAR
jgi:hypothetical protein